MARVAKYDGMLFEVTSFAENLFTGEGMVILKRYFSNPRDFVSLGTSYAAVISWVVPISEFNERFEWVDA